MLNGENRYQANKQEHRDNHFIINWKEVRLEGWAGARSHRTCSPRSGTWVLSLLFLHGVVTSFGLCLRNITMITTGEIDRWTGDEGAEVEMETPVRKLL